MIPLVEEFKAFDCLLLRTSILVPLLSNYILGEGEVHAGAAVEVRVRTRQVLILVLLV